METPRAYIGAYRAVTFSRRHRDAFSAQFLHTAKIIDTLLKAELLARSQPGQRFVPVDEIRGTAATRLLRAGLSLAQIAACMGWSIRTAALMIERYAKVSPEETDEVLAALAAAK